MRLHQVLIDDPLASPWQRRFGVYKFNAAATWAVGRLEDPVLVLAFGCFALVLKQAQVVGQNPSLRHNLVIFAEIADLGLNVPVHEVFSAQLPSTCEVIAVLVLIKLLHLFSFQWRWPNDIPWGTLSLAKAIPCQRVDHTIVDMRIGSDLILQLEQTIFHPKNTFACWPLLPHLRRILEKYYGFSALKLRILQVNRSAPSEGVFRRKVPKYLMLHRLLHWKGHHFLSTFLFIGFRYLLWQRGETAWFLI